MEEDLPSVLHLLKLPPEVLARVIMECDLEAAFCFAQTCSSAREAVLSDELVWQPKCVQGWASRTRLQHWMVPRSRRARSLSSCARWADSSDDTTEEQLAHNYLQLFRLLSCYDKLVGMWRVVGEGPKGGLYSFTWGEDAMVMTHHAGHMRAGRLRPQQVARLHPSCPTGHALLFIDDARVSLGGRAVTHAEHVGVRRLPLDTSSSSPQRGVAVAAAAAGGSPSTSPSPAKLRALRLQPPSPPMRGGGSGAAAASSLDVASSSHFASSYISFLDCGLAPSGGRRRERRRDARGQHAGSLDSTASATPTNARPTRTAMHHLHRTQHYTRLHVPLATAATPLAGMWRGVYPGHGLEVVVLDYSADGDVLRATKVTGDTPLPAGEVSWIAELCSRQRHLTPDEEDTFDVLEAEAWEQAGAWADEAAADGGGSDGEGDGSRVLYRRHNVLACTQARGRLEALGPWVGGRLWEYDDGAVGLAYVQELRTVIRFNRVALADLAGVLDVR